MEPTTDPKIDHFMQPKIAGYRQLGAEEAALINQAKALGSQFEELINRLRDYHRAQRTISDKTSDESARLDNAEPARWLTMGRTDIQTGVMKIVRSIAQPAS